MPPHSLIGNQEILIQSQLKTEGFSEVAAPTHQWIVNYKAEPTASPQQIPLQQDIQLGSITLNPLNSDYLCPIEFYNIFENSSLESAKDEAHEALIQVCQYSDTGTLKSIFFVPGGVGVAFRLPQLKNIKVARISEDSLKVVFPAILDAPMIAEKTEGEKADRFVTPSTNEWTFDAEKEISFSQEGSEYRIRLVKRVQGAAFHFADLLPFLPYVASSIIVVFLLLISLSTAKKQNVEVQTWGKKTIKNLRPQVVKVAPRQLQKTSLDRKPSKEYVKGRKRTKGNAKKGLKKPNTEKIRSPREVASKYRSKVKRKPREQSLNTIAKRSVNNQLGLLKSLKKKSQSQAKKDQLSSEALLEDRKWKQDQSQEKLKSGHLSNRDVDENRRLAQAKTSLSELKNFNRKTPSLLAQNKGVANINVKAFVQANKEAFEQLVTGGLGIAEVQTSLRPTQGDIKKCYEESLTINPGLKGKMRYRWSISPQGRVSGVRLIESDIRFPRLETCITQAIQNTSFPRAPTGAASTVNYKFTLEEI